MELQKSHRDLLIQLSKQGFIGNWYNAFGIYKLRIYKQEGNEDSISLSMDKNRSLDITFNYAGQSSFFDSKEERNKAFDTAISIYKEHFNRIYQ